MLDRRGGLQLGLNAIVSFIISVLIFGFGIYLLGVFMDGSILPPPDRCANDLNTGLMQGRTLVVCPTTFYITESQMRQGFSVAYAYQNIGNVERTLFFHVNTTHNNNFTNQLSPIVIPANSARQGLAVIGLEDGVNAPDISYIRVTLCEDSDNIDYCIPQEEIITIRKR
ncbi:MAG: hypothetical protein ACMXYL_03805 [Candidatus Woesearchaeota archaeon]